MRISDWSSDVCSSDLEAYFSNFIEGTRFDVQEARQINETGRPMPARDEDSHYVLGTYQIVGNRQEMASIPQDADQLIEILRYRHRILLIARPSKNPGEFKDRNNRAGDTEFVDRTLVRGTLMRGFDFYRALNHSFAKADYKIGRASCRERVGQIVQSQVVTVPLNKKKEQQKKE